jgi:hypothetical protein
MPEFSDEVAKEVERMRAGREQIDRMQLDKSQRGKKFRRVSQFIVAELTVNDVKPDLEIRVPHFKTEKRRFSRGVNIVQTGQEVYNGWTLERFTEQHDIGSMHSPAVAYTSHGSLLLSSGNVATFQSREREASSGNVVVSEPLRSFYPERADFRDLESMEAALLRFAARHHEAIDLERLAEVE